VFFYCTIQVLKTGRSKNAGCKSDVALVIATGEQRIYANILLTIGVVPPPK